MDIGRYVVENMILLSTVTQTPSEPSLAKYLGVQTPVHHAERHFLNT